VLISLMDGSLVWSNRYHQSGTLMPSGAVHPIFASEAKQSILCPPKSGLLRRFAPRNDGPEFSSRRRIFQSGSEEARSAVSKDGADERQMFYTA
jgi:hypothetical protein